MSSSHGASARVGGGSYLPVTEKALGFLESKKVSNNGTTTNTCAAHASPFSTFQDLKAWTCVRDQPPVFLSVHGGFRPFDEREGAKIM